MTRPCTDCAHYESRHGVHYCALKQRDTSIARITNTERADCFEVRRTNEKKIEVK